MCLPATTAVFKALIRPAALKSVLAAVADASQPDETGDEWSTFASIEYIAHLCGRGESTVRADLKRLEHEWLARVGEYSGVNGQRNSARYTYILNKERILAARDPFFGPPSQAELELYHGRPPPKVSGGQSWNNSQPPPEPSGGEDRARHRPALNFSKTGAEVQQTGAEVQHSHIRKELFLTVDERRASRAAFADQASAVAAVLEVVGLGEEDAAALRSCGYDAPARRFIARSESQFRRVQTSAGRALRDLGLRLACGGA